MHSSILSGLLCSPPRTTTILFLTVPCVISLHLPLMEVTKADEPILLSHFPQCCWWSEFRCVIQYPRSVILHHSDWLCVIYVSLCALACAWKACVRVISRKACKNRSRCASIYAQNKHVSRWISQGSKGPCKSSGPHFSTLLGPNAHICLSCPTFECTSERRRADKVRQRHILQAGCIKVLDWVTLRNFLPQ